MSARRAASRPIPGVTGRNAPCPCGSGRKYKRCCAVKSAGLPLASRVALAALATILLGGLVYFIVSLDEFTASGPGPQRVWSEAHQHWH